MQAWHFLILLLLLLPVVHAESGHITLLTVSEMEDEETGGTADLFLDVQPGTGRIFIDSFPLTRLDTQISARFAKEVACDFLDHPCHRYDFFYTIRSGSTIVGGPSAGAAITLLTISVMGDIPLDDETVITGTINSGGIIGPVAGIAAKAEAAKQANKTKILIPSIDIPSSNRSNVSRAVPEGIEVVRVGNIEDALFEFTGKRFKEDPGPIQSTEAYDALMRRVADRLCARYTTTAIDLGDSSRNSSLQEEAQLHYNSSREAAARGAYYSQASYCFGANLRLTQLQYAELAQEDLLDVYKAAWQKNRELDQELENISIDSLSTLETYMIVKERIVDSQQTLQDINRTDISPALLAYAVERYYSAVAWSAFFELETAPFHLDKEALEMSCFEKIAEAEERINYVSLYIPSPLAAQRDTLRLAYRDAEQGDYELCLFKASAAKADADVLLSSLFVDNDQVETLLEEKFLAAERVLADQQGKGIFPVLGYSYYQYAESLQDTEPASALLYLEYALELSNLDMYFPPQEDNSFFRYLTVPSPKDVLILVGGLLAGFIIGVLAIRHQMKKTQEDSKNARNLPGKKR